MEGGFDKNSKMFSFRFSSILLENNDGYTRKAERKRFPISPDELSTFFLFFLAFDRFRIKWSVKSQDEQNDFAEITSEWERRGKVKTNHILLLCFWLFTGKLFLKFFSIVFDLFSPDFILHFNFFLFCFTDQPKDGNYDDGKLIIVTDSQILAIPLHRCNSEKINSCRYVAIPTHSITLSSIQDESFLINFLLACLPQIL